MQKMEMFVFVHLIHAEKSQPEFCSVSGISPKKQAHAPFIYLIN